jgi:hypothetical protein
LTDREINFLSKQGYTLAEIYYMASLAKASGKTVTSVAALHSQGVGWGVLAHRLGVRPDALRKLIVREKKAEKMERKEQKNGMIKQREKKLTVTPTPLKERMENPKLEQREMGGGRGHGR